jgi:hypothetical protein
MGSVGGWVRRASPVQLLIVDPGAVRAGVEDNHFLRAHIRSCCVTGCR